MLQNLGFQFISKVGVAEVHKTEKQGTLLSDAVVFGNLFLHVLFQERHVAEKTTGKGPEQLEEQFYVSVIPFAVIQQTVGQQLGLLPVGGSHILLPVSLLKGLANPHTPQLAHQRMLIGQPGVIVFNYNTYDLSKKRQLGNWRGSPSIPPEL